MKRTGYLFAPICDFHNLLVATRLAARGGKKYRPTIAAFLLNQEKELVRLQQQLQDKSYRPRPYRQFTIYDPKQRTISVADFRDRVVYHALCRHLGPLLDKSIIDDSYACRPGKGLHLALSRASSFVNCGGYFLKLDIAKYFDSIDHHRLKALLARKIKDRDVLWLIDVIIDHVLPGNQLGRGLPIGNLTSQHFANYYLSPMDHHIANDLRIHRYCRYMDDMLLLAKDKNQLWGAYQEIVLFLQERLGLTLKDRATLLAPVEQGVPFLGFKIFPGRIRLLKKSWKRFKKHYLRRRCQYYAGEITAEKLVQSITSMTNYIACGDTGSLRGKFFDTNPIEV